MLTPCIICCRSTVSSTTTNHSTEDQCGPDSTADTGQTEAPVTLKLFFQTLERYLNENSLDGNSSTTDDDDNDEAPMRFLFEQVIHAGMRACDDCFKIVESFCQLYHLIKSVKLLLNWRLETLKDIMGGAHNDPSRMMGFREGAKLLEIEDISADEVIELVIDFKEDLIKKCSHKLKASLPKVILKKCKPEEEARKKQQFPPSTSSQASSAIIIASSNGNRDMQNMDDAKMSDIPDLEQSETSNIQLDLNQLSPPPQTPPSMKSNMPMIDIEQEKSLRVVVEKLRTDDDGAPTAPLHQPEMTASMERNHLADGDCISDMEYQPQPPQSDSDTDIEAEDEEDTEQNNLKSENKTKTAKKSDSSPTPNLRFRHHCNNCAKTFSSVDQLVEHRRSHKGGGNRDMRDDGAEAGLNDNEKESVISNQSQSDSYNPADDDDDGEQDDEAEGGVSVSEAGSESSKSTNRESSPKKLRSRHRCKKCIRTFSTQRKLKEHNQSHITGVEQDMMEIEKELNDIKSDSDQGQSNSEDSSSENDENDNNELIETVKVTTVQVDKGKGASIKTLRNKNVSKRISRNNSSKVGYKCPHCGKRFREQSACKRHQRTAHHHVRAKYRCNRCNRSYGQKGQLQEHQWFCIGHRTPTETTTAAGKRKHGCDKCGKGFELKKYLRRHRRKAHLENG